MRRSLLIILLAAILTGSVYWYQTMAANCPVPLAYRIGTIDESFNLDEAAARAYVDNAVALWESAADRDLFYFDENADLRVDFIFDERQLEADTEARLKAQLDAKRDKNQEVLETVESMQTSHNDLHNAYESQVSEYERRLAAYNERVRSYNDRGGAPSDVFAELEEERVALNEMAESLSETASKLNELADDINELAARGNQMVNEYNNEVNRYNAKYGFAREFTQGDYQRNVINIYKFSSDTELVTVLAHELGHALGIDHVEGSSSVMYYLLEDMDSEPTLSAEDLAAYYEACGVSETMSQKIHRVIRNFTSNLF